MERELRNPPGVHMPQAHYSHVARVGNTLYLAGQLGMDVSGKVVGVGDAKAQARQCYENLATILAHYGGGLRDLVKTTTFITHWGYRPLVAAARDEVFPAPTGFASHSTIGATLIELPINSISRAVRASATGMSHTWMSLTRPRVRSVAASSSRRSDVHPDRM